MMKSGELQGKMLVYGGTWQNNMVCQLLLLRASQSIMNALSVCGVTYTDVWSLYFTTHSTHLKMTINLIPIMKSISTVSIMFICLVSIQHFSHSLSLGTTNHFLWKETWLRISCLLEVLYITIWYLNFHIVRVEVLWYKFYWYDGVAICTQSGRSTPK